MAEKKVNFGDGLSQEAEQVKVWAQANVWIAIGVAAAVGFIIGWLL